jgi:gliding motility-associated-like protein
MVLTETHVDANCNLSNGSATVSVTGGVGPYSYSWSTLPVQNTATATALAANTYVATVTDANGCSQNISVTVNNLAGPTATVFSTTNVSCNGLCDGNAVTSVSGGTSPFAYSWSNGQSLPTATNLCAGTYTLTATDVNGCVATVAATVTEPAVLTTTSTSTNPVCFGSLDGTITTTTNGGTTPYSYLWTPGSATTSNLSGLAAGTYQLQATDANGCITITNVTINNPPAITASTTTTDVTCSGLCNGTATVTLSSGTGPITYLWSDINHQDTPSAIALCAGTYSVTATDANGCSATATAIINTPGSLSVNITSFGNVSCFGACDGFAAAAVSGGTAPFGYMWNTTPVATAGAAVNNLCASTYTVTVTDANGCSATTSQLITQPNALVASITNTDVTCYGACDAQATAVYAGGTGPYTFLWTPALQTTPTVTALCAGIQNLQITDSHGCVATNSVVIIEPTILAVTTTTTNSDCGTSNGTACAQITGGSLPFTYIWSDPLNQATSCATSLDAGVYTISVTDGHNCSVTAVANLNDNGAPIVTIPTSSDVTCAGAANGSAQGAVTGGVVPYNIAWTTTPVQTNTFANNLAGGTYSLIVTDSVGCVGNASVMINEPTPLISTIISSVNTSCNLTCDGSLTVQAGGGTAPYTYLWNDVNTQTTVTADSLCAQSYSVTITDANGCTTVSIDTVLEPAPIVFALDSLHNVSCNGGNNGLISIIASGGSPGYTYSWMPSATASPSVTGLTAGTYSLTVTDMHGCPHMVPYIITEPTQMILSPNSNNSTCGNANGGASVGVTGGTPFATSPYYTYLWSNGATTGLVTTGLSAGTYSVVVTDANGCTADTTSTVANTPGPVIPAGGITYTSPSCFGFTNGTATVTATGGTPLYSYSWNTVPVQTVYNPTGLPAGVYTVTVTDMNTCTATGTINIPAIAPLDPIALPTQTICLGQSATIYPAFSGGTPPYTYTWSPTSVGTGAGPFIVTPTTPGTTVTYTVTANDGACVNTQTINVIVNPLLVVNAANNSGCFGKPIVLNALATGGAGAPYTYSWTPATDLDTAMGPNVISNPTISSGTITYTVTVTDNAGCSVPASANPVVTVNPLPVAFIVPGTLAGCEPLTTSFNANSLPAGTYSWNFGDGSPAQTGSSVAHTYQYTGVPYYVTLTTTTVPDGCVDSTKLNPAYVDVYPAPVAGFTTSPATATITAPMIAFTNQSTGADSLIHWDFYYTDPLNNLYTSTEANPSFSYVDTGLYVVQQIVYNNYGCSDTAYSDVEISPEYVLYAPNAFTPLNHDGINDVFMPSGVGIDPNNFEMMIFDRWGNLIFKTTDLAKGWDGKANGGSNVALTDVYVWKIETKDFRGDKHSYVGHVTIVK